MPTSTLTSLAILRVTVDRGGDYLEYLRPFVLQALQSVPEDPVVDETVAKIVRDRFGLVIPNATIQILLKRIAKQGLIVRDHGQYKRARSLDNLQIDEKWTETQARINDVVAGLYDYSQKSSAPFADTENAATAICAFLAEFDVACLKAYLQGTVIPEIEGDYNREIVLVSCYVRELYVQQESRFNNFVTLMQGHMLANALLCPDLDQAPQSYRSVEFYFDTPVVLELLGLESDARNDAARELVAQLDRLGGQVLILAHTRDEVVRVLRHVADLLENSSGNEERGITLEARKRGATRSDLLLMVERIDDLLSAAGIDVKPNPRYREEYQIDEEVFESILKEEIQYLNPRARIDDINSVRSIYALRGRLSPTSLERSKAVLVTSNTRFAKAAWQYGQAHESTIAVSSVITSFTLANTAWLKRPLESLHIPRTQLLGAVFAALQPSEALLTKYMSEIERLELEGSYSDRELQLLRSSTSAHAELMYFTLGEDAALTDETVAQTLERVTTEIRAEERSKRIQSEEAHRQTQERLTAGQTSYRAVGEQLVARSSKRSRRYSSVVAGLVAALLVAGLTSGAWLPNAGSIRWLGSILSGALLFWQMLGIFISSDAVRVHNLLKRKLFDKFLKKEALALNYDLDSLDLDI